MSGGVNKAGGFLSKLRSAFRERFVVSHDYEPYMPPSPPVSGAASRDGNLPIAYRYPAPASQPAAEVPTSPPETVYETHYYTRPMIKVKATTEAEQALYDSHVAAQDETFKDSPNPPPHPISLDPRHTPHPWWYYDDAALAGFRQHFIESGGLIPMGWHRDMRGKPGTIVVGTNRS